MGERPAPGGKAKACDGLKWVSPVKMIASVVAITPTHSSAPSLPIIVIRRYSRTTAVATVAIARNVPFVIVNSRNVVPMAGMESGIRCAVIVLCSAGQRYSAYAQSRYSPRPSRAAR